LILIVADYLPKVINSQGLTSNAVGAK
jgi:hypothetical protein